MSYVITHANGTASPITIADGQIDTSTSITLVGKNTPNYGAYLNQNFFNMLENFAAPSSPASPLIGQLWYDTSQNLLKIWNGSYFKNVASAAAGSVAPLNPSTGDLWFDTVHTVLKCYTPSVGWLTIGPTSAGNTVQQSILDSGNNPHNCLLFQISGTTFAILSYDAAFTPLNPGLYPGFSTISPGFNIANTSFVTNNKFWGQASDSFALNGIPGTNFMRSDQNTGTSGFLAITNNVGLKVGTTGQGLLNISSNEVRLDNSLNNGVIRFRTRDGSGNAVDSLDVLANADVQVNYNLIVHGKLFLDNPLSTLTLSGTTPSISTTTGTLIIPNPYGGIGVAGNINVGGTIISAGNISAQSANVYANYINANTAVYSPQIGTASSLHTGLITTNAQPYITSLGTQSVLNVTGTSGFVGNVNITGNLNLANSAARITGGAYGYTLATDGNANLFWLPPAVSPVGSGGAAGQVAIYNSPTTIAANTGIYYNGANLAVTGNFTATGDIVAYYSDQRLKTNIAPIENALQKVNMINGVTYNTSDLAEKLGLGDNKSHVGVLAQEIQSVLPEVVRLAPFDSDIDGHSKSGEHYLTVQYDKIIPLLIQAIKELSAEVEELKKRI